MELNINSPVYYKDHYGIDNAVYRFTQRAYLFFREKEYSKYPNSSMGAVIAPECQAWIDMVENHPEEIPDKLKSIIAETRNNLRIR